MIRTVTIAEHRRGAGSENLPVGGLRNSMVTLWTLLIKHAAMTSKKFSSGKSSPKKLMTSITNKAIHLRRKKRIVGGGGGGGEELEGVWRRTILMGDKCQPLDFSGVIFYDGDGNRVNELPSRSPRASPMPSYAYKSERSSDKSRLGY